MKCDTPNEISIRLHLSTEYTIVGHNHLLNIGTGKSPSPLTSRKFDPSILFRPYFMVYVGCEFLGERQMAVS